MPPRDETIDALLNLPEEQQKDIFGKLSPEAKQGLFESMGKDYTLGERYRFRRAAGMLPQGSAGTSFLANPSQALGEAAGEAGNLAQQYQYAETGMGGPKPSLASQGVNDLLSGLFAGGQVAFKIGGALSDPKTLAAFIVSKLGPPGAAAAALYFGYSSTQGLADAIHSGKITPENLQNALLSGAGIAGSGAMAGEAPSVKPITPADIKARLQPFARQVTGAEAATRDAVSKSAEKYAEKAPAQDAKIAKIEEENALQRKRSRFRAGEEEYKLKTKNEQIERENQQAQTDFERTKTERQAAQAQSERQANAAKESIQQVENKVYEEANRKYEAVREKIGAGRPGEPEESPAPLLDAVKSVQRTILQGIPENIALFRSILKLDEDSAALNDLRTQVMQGQGMTGRYEGLTDAQKAVVDDIVQRYGGQITEGEPVTWSKLQRIKSESEKAIRSRSTPPIIKEALRRVNDVTVDTMGRMAESRGAGEDWAEARDFYRQWREDFHTTTGPQGSASPVAQTLEAVDPYAISRNLRRTQQEGTGENRAVKILRKYGQFGGNEAATAVEQHITTQGGIGKEPKPPIAKSPEPSPTVSKLYPQKEVPPPTPRPTVNVEEVSRKAVEQRAKNWGSFNARDVGILASSVIAGPLIRLLFGRVEENASSLLPTAAITYEGGKFLSSRLLRDPKVVDWLAKAPPQEIMALRNIPGADKVTIINGITESAVETLKTMNFGSDNTAFDKAKAELGENASLSDISRRAAQLNAEEMRNRQQRFNQAKKQAAGRPVAISPEMKAFLGPANVAKIMAAAGTGGKPVQNRREALQVLQQQ